MDYIPELFEPSRQIDQQIKQLNIEVEPVIDEKENLVDYVPGPLLDTDIKRIKDWDAYYRINSCPPETIKILKQCQEKCKEWCNIRDTATWKMQEENSKERLTVECYTSARGNNSFKACCFLPFEPWLVFRVLDNPAYKHLYDVNIDWE